MAAHSAINTFIFLKKVRKKIIFCWKQLTGKEINLGKPLIKKNPQTFPKTKKMGRERKGLGEGRKMEMMEERRKWKEKKREGKT